MLRRRRALKLRRLRRDLIEICAIAIIAFVLTFIALRSLSDSKGGTIDPNTVLLSSVTVSLIAGYVAAIATLMPGQSQDIRDRED
jgi:uncharacterized membrane protein